MDRRRNRKLGEVKDYFSQLIFPVSIQNGLNILDSKPKVFKTDLAHL
jgi:hypothetical protein